MKIYKNDFNKKVFKKSEDLFRWQKIKGWFPYTSAQALFGATKLASNLIGRNVEIGSYAGRSTICIASALAEAKNNDHVVSIDICHQPEFDVNLSAFNLLHLVDKLQGDSHYWGNIWQDPISMLFLDGDHSEEACLTDFLLWGSHIIHNGLLVLDDTAGAIYQGPALAELIAISSGAYESVISVSGTSILKKISSNDIILSCLDFINLQAYIAIRHVSTISAAMDPDLVLPKRKDEKLDKVYSRLDNSNRILQNIINISSDRRNDTLLYLYSVLQFQLGFLEEAIIVMESLASKELSLFSHYNLHMKPFVYLRLAQFNDTAGNKCMANAYYSKLLNLKSPEILIERAITGMEKGFSMLPPVNYKYIRYYHTNSPFYKFENVLPMIDL